MKLFLFLWSAFAISRNDCRGQELVKVNSVQSKLPQNKLRGVFKRPRSSGSVSSGQIEAEPKPLFAVDKLELYA